MTQKYLLATDGTPVSDEAERYAKQLLDPDHAELLLATVLEDVDEEQLQASKEDINLETLDSRRQKEASNMLESRAESYREKGFDVRTEVLHGQPGEELCKLGREENVRGIFLGRGKKGQLGEWFYGSVSHYVLLNADRSVIVTPSSTEETEEPDYRTSRMDK